MAIQCNVLYRGAQINGARFTVLSAYLKDLSAAHPDGSTSFLAYEVEVKMPDGSVISVPEWQNIKAETGIGTPLAQAESNMSARLVAAGATNMVTL